MEIELAKNVFQIHVIEGGIQTWTPMEGHDWMLIDSLISRVTQIRA